MYNIKINFNTYKVLDIEIDMIQIKVSHHAVIMDRCSTSVSNMTLVQVKCLCCPWVLQAEHSGHY